MCAITDLVVVMLYLFLNLNYSELNPVKFLMKMSPRNGINLFLLTVNSVGALDYKIKYNCSYRVQLAFEISFIHSKIFFFWCDSLLEGFFPRQSAS